MFAQLTSAKELEALMMSEARKSDKLPTKLTGISVLPFGHRGDWRVSSSWSGAGASEDCRNELTAIEIRLKERGFGLKA